ncbi:MAG: DHHW family protein [Oscillospiraceae bacterium]
MEKIKKLLVIICFGLVIFGLAVAHVIIPDAEASAVERRKLAQMPKISADAVFSSEYSTKLETYFLDQFPLRDSFRTAKAFVNFDLLRVKDNNDIYFVDDGIYKLSYPLKENQVTLAAKKIEQILAEHPQIGNAYFSLIPDKNYFVAAQNGYPSIDYSALLSQLREQVSSAEYIDIYDCLELSDYYRTDTHWQQNKIHAVAQRLCDSLGVPCAPLSDYKENTLEPFYGVFAGQAALPVEADKIVYLTSPATENAKVTSVEQTAPMKVYTLDDFKGNDPYDVFLSGAEAVITIENPKAKTDKELIIFRDSFGSSLTPLLIDSYAKITLLDLRYIGSSLIDDYANFEGSDVLFLYSTMLVNSGGILK